MFEWVDIRTLPTDTCTLFPVTTWACKVMSVYGERTCNAHEKLICKRVGVQILPSIGNGQCDGSQTLTIPPVESNHIMNMCWFPESAFKNPWFD